jgi:AraC-like DNA-binding protein
MILTTLPDLPPRPETLANAAFRRRFYERWGRENAIVCGHGRHAEYAAIPQTLSIKMTLGGRERYFLPRRELVVDDDNLLVLNEGARYGSLLKAPQPAWTFAIFFRPGMQDEVAAQHRRGLAAALDSPVQPARPALFAEHLRPHQGPVSARLKRIAHDVLAGERDEAWLEEQLTVLLDAMLAHEHDDVADSAPRPAQRAELHRRLHRAADHIESHYPQPLTLATLAEIARLSRCHFVREFSRLFGLSPHAYLTRKRARAALGLIDGGHRDAEWIAQCCGFGSRWSLQRALVRHRSGDPAESGAQFLHTDAPH